MARLDGKIVLVAGASQGMGRVTAIRAAEAGAHVIVAARRRDVCEAVVAEIAAAGGKAEAHELDAVVPASCAALCAAIGARHGRLDAAFNNVGKQQGQAPLDEIPLERWNRAVDVNLNSAFYLMRAEIALLRAAGGGAIVNNSSAAGTRGIKAMTDYSAAKWGVIGLTKSAALDYGRENIRVNVITPGIIRTEAFDAVAAAKPELVEQFKARSVAGRFGTMDEIARLVVWLMSDEASYLSGAVIPVDGGDSAG